MRGDGTSKDSTSYEKATVIEVHALDDLHSLQKL